MKNEDRDQKRNLSKHAQSIMHLDSLWRWKSEEKAKELMVENQSPGT